MTVPRPEAVSTGVLAPEPLALPAGALAPERAGAPAPEPQALFAGAPEPDPIWLTAGSWPLLGFVHEPVGPTRGAVVLCPPLFGEQLGARPLYRVVGRALAEQGLLALRFDYEGTGDSGGPSTGPGRLEAWLDAVDQATSAVRERVRGPIALLGVRSGALVAAAAAERRTDVDAIALWDPWRSGRSFLRREHALHALQFRTPPDAGHLEVAGLVLDDDSAAELAALRLPPRLRARRALLVVRPGTRPAAVALEARRGGSALRTTADVLEAAPGEQEALFEGDALRRRIPAVTIANVVQWLADASAQLGPPPAWGGGQGSTVGATPGTAARHARTDGAGPARGPAPASGLVAIQPAVPGETTVYERSVRLGHHGLFGIESVPSPSVSPEAPVVLFFPSGMDSHIGPHRLWVTLARRWASLGARCIRVDLSGLGESPPRPGRAELVMRAPEAFDDVAEVVRAVGGPERVVLVGLCSSAYQALESAVELEPFGVLAVNPLLRFTPPEVEAGGEMSSRRRLCQPRRDWEQAARRILPGPVGKALADTRRWLGRHSGALHRGAAVLRRQGPLQRGAPGRARLDVAGALAATDVRIVCRQYEADQLGAFGLADRPAEGFRIEVVPDLEHSLALAAQRQDVADRLTTMLRAMAGSRLHALRRTRPPTATPDLVLAGHGASEGRAIAGGAVEAAGAVEPVEGEPVGAVEVEGA